MPVFTITDSKTGKTMDVRGDRAPTQDEAAALFAQQSAPRPRTWTDTAVDALPMAGGAVGGIVGGIGGTVLGMGMGGAPGAIGGAALGGGAGEAARQLINRARGAEAPATSGQAAADIGIQGGVQGALEGAGQAIPAALKAGGTAIYRGYLKPSLSRVNLPKAAQIVKDAISEALPVTAAGAQRAQQMIGELNGKVDAMLSQATGKTVNLSEIANGVRGWAKRMYDRPGRDPRDYEAAVKVADRIDQHPSLANPFDPASDATATLPAANTIKRDLQGAVRDKFGVPGGTAETASEKYASSQMREGIEAQAPEVGPLNARQSRLMDVARTINQAVGREGNQSVTNGAKTLASLGTVGAVAGGTDYARRGNVPEAALTGAVAALGERMLLTPAVMSRAAILAVKLGERLPGTAVADIARTAIQAASEASQNGQNAPQ